MFKSQLTENNKSKQSGDDHEGVQKEFESRIQGLREKGEKRGKKYSMIGIIFSLLIFIFSMTAGYILFEQISNLTKEASVSNIKNNFQNIIDPDRRCNTSCCLASLEKMRKFKYSEVKSTDSCQPGYLKTKLQCDTSLFWCQPIKKEEVVPERNFLNIDNSLEETNN